MQALGGFIAHLVDLVLEGLAIEQAGELRFLPVVLTSLTAIGGLIPLAINPNPQISPLALVPSQAGRPRPRASRWELFLPSCLGLPRLWLVTGKTRIGAQPKDWESFR